MRESTICIFEAGRGALAPVGASEWTVAPSGAIDRRGRTDASDRERRSLPFATTTERPVPGLGSGLWMGRSPLGARVASYG